MMAAFGLILGGAAAGVFGSLLGLGGGVLIVPLLTLVFGLPLREAVGVSLVSVIVTSSAAAGVYLQRHVANLRLGMVLELFTATGALVGGLIAFLLDERVLAGLFAALLAWVGVSMIRRSESSAPEPEPARDPAAEVDDETDTHTWHEADHGRFETFEADLSGADYRIRRLPFGMGGSIFAGLVSALLGVGGGIVKVPVMHLVMGVPLKVATATSNMMIGITATSSAMIYLLRGGIDPFVAGPTALGVFVGATVGTRIAGRIDVRILRFLFAAVLLYTAFVMAQKALAL